MKEDREIVPLRTILQNCLNHIENLESNRSICDNYEKEFQDLKQFSETLKVRKEFACTEGEKEVNRKKNRYKDILPFNVSRVILSKYAGIPGSDYINANFIKGASGSPAYIASQGPLPNTVNDFWRMVVECEVQVIVMACNAEEAGKHKCENYWVEKEGEEKRFGMVEICLVKASTVCPDFLVRTMRLKYTNDKSVTEERTICQFHYSAWPDHGVPPLVRPLLDMVRLVRDTQASETLPVLVHCSAGCGRTGTICAIDFVWGLLRAGKLTEEFSLFNLVKDMRKQRVAMVQTKEQYILVHQAVRELFKEQLRVIESHPYENIDVNGVPLIKDIGEEPLYDTIGPCKNDCDEKHDENEVEKSEIERREMSNNSNKQDAAAPPLPRKKRPNVPFSKHEKEVENFTEKNRAMEREKEALDVSPSNSLLSKPRIAKLKALFERSPTNRERNAKHRGSQTVSRSHSLGAIRKPLFSEAVIDNNPPERRQANQPPSQPIPDGGKLKVPKLSLSAVASKPVPIIKRSKSLKTISQPQKLSCPAPPPPPPPPPPPLLPVVDKLRKPREVSPVKKPETVSKATFKKSMTMQDLESYKRRRSLESLIGDEAITWPSAMKPGQPTRNISAESIKHQFQNLTIEAHKRMNTLVSGIGVRERRNSFRQAISKDDGQAAAAAAAAKQNRSYEYIWTDPKKRLESKTIQVGPPWKNFSEGLTVRNQNGEILHPGVDETDGGSKAQRRPGRLPQELTRPPDKSAFTAVHRDERQSSKNLFLQRLNIEIQEGKKADGRRGGRVPEDRRRPLPESRSNPNFLGIYPFRGESSRKGCEGAEHRPRMPQVDESHPRLSHAAPSNYPKNRKPQVVDLRKNFFSGANSVSSHSSGEMSHSDQHSRASDSLDGQDAVEGVPRPEIIRLKSSNPIRDRKSWMDDGGGRHDHGSESSSSSSARELASVLPPKPPEEVYNYGIVASVKLRPSKANHSRDDFLLGEPVAPPRVKRHASVKLPRQGGNEASAPHLSAWTSPEKKKTQLETNNWNDALGVDLDAVAASMQRQKAESSGLGDSSKVYSASSSSAQPPPQPPHHFPFKKQQHYL